MFQRYTGPPSSLALPKKSIQQRRPKQIYTHGCSATDLLAVFNSRCLCLWRWWKMRVSLVKEWTGMVESHRLHTTRRPRRLLAGTKTFARPSQRRIVPNLRAFIRAIPAFDWSPFRLACAAARAARARDTVSGKIRKEED